MLLGVNYSMGAVFNATPAAIVACAANISAFASMTCCGESGSIVVNNDSQLRECRYLQPARLSM